MTVKTPEDATPGSYRGALEVAAGAQRLELPIALDVRPMTLPKQRRMYLEPKNPVDPVNPAKNKGPK